MAGPSYPQLHEMLDHRPRATETRCPPFSVFSVLRGQQMFGLPASFDLRISSFGFLSLFGFRHSSFIGHWPPACLDSSFILPWHEPVEGRLHPFPRPAPFPPASPEHPSCCPDRQNQRSPIATRQQPDRRPWPPPVLFDNRIRAETAGSPHLADERLSCVIPRRTPRRYSRCRRNGRTLNCAKRTQTENRSKSANNEMIQSETGGFRGVEFTTKWPRMAARCTRIH